jgi:hypothetical protein
MESSYAILKLITGEVLFGKFEGIFDGNVKINKPYTFFNGEQGISIGSYDAALVQGDLEDVTFNKQSIIYFASYDHNNSVIEAYKKAVSPLILPTKKIII